MASEEDSSLFESTIDSSSNIGSKQGRRIAAQETWTHTHKPNDREPEMVNKTRILYCCNNRPHRRLTYFPGQQVTQVTGSPLPNKYYIYNLNLNYQHLTPVNTKILCDIFSRTFSAIMSYNSTIRTFRWRAYTWSRSLILICRLCRILCSSSNLCLDKALRFLSSKTAFIGYLRLWSRAPRAFLLNCSPEFIIFLRKKKYIVHCHLIALDYLIEPRNCSI